MLFFCDTAAIKHNNTPYIYRKNEGPKKFSWNSSKTEAFPTSLVRSIETSIQVPGEELIFRCDYTCKEYTAGLQWVNHTTCIPFGIPCGTQTNHGNGYLPCSRESTSVSYNHPRMLNISYCTLLF